MTNNSGIPWFVDIAVHQWGTESSRDMWPAWLIKAKQEHNKLTTSQSLGFKQRHATTVDGNKHYLVHSIAHDDFKWACEQLLVLQRFLTWTQNPTAGREDSFQKQHRARVVMCDWSSATFWVSSTMSSFALPNSQMGESCVSLLVPACISSVQWRTSRRYIREV